MQLFDPNIIELNNSKLTEIDDCVKKIYRLITFSKKHSSKDLLDRYFRSTYNLTELLSLKNAQMEAQNEEEAMLFLKDLRRSILFIIKGIRNNTPFKSELQLFELFRIISPESHQRHPNRYRDHVVQIGRYICPHPSEINYLVNDLFYKISGIQNTIIRAIYFHHELIRIHPFIDANGRTTRIAKNWILMYDLYPPIFIKDKAEKSEYINALTNSFKVLEEDSLVWHQETALFFDHELDRIHRNVNIVLRDINKSFPKTRSVPM